MPTPRGQMTVALTEELEQFVRDKIREGTFATPSEYIRDLVRARYHAERDRDARLRAVEAALAEGVADAEAGRLVPVGEAFARVRAALGVADGGETA